jgi:hypothetical protein
MEVPLSVPLEIFYGQPAATAGNAAAKVATLSSIKYLLRMAMPYKNQVRFKFLYAPQPMFVRFHGYFDSR